MVVPAIIGALYLGSAVSLWIPVVCLVLLSIVAIAYITRGDRSSALFVLLCIVTFLPAIAGWYVLVPALGSVLLLTANLAHRRWRRIFVPHASLLVVASVVVVLAGVATLQWVTSSLRESSGSFEWRVLPGQDYGFFAVTIIVIVASIVNATFEELLWRSDLSRGIWGAAVAVKPNSA